MAVTISQLSVKDEVLDAVPELLESIILALPPEDIFLAARVCKRWHDVIQTSPAILKRLRTTPFFLIEDFIVEESGGRFMCLIFEGCDIIIRQAGECEVIAILQNPLPQSKKPFAITFVESRDRIPGLTPLDRDALHLSGYAMMRKRSNGHYDDKGTLKRIERGALLYLHPAEEQRIDERLQMSWETEYYHFDNLEQRIDAWMPFAGMPELENALLRKKLWLARIKYKEAADKLIHVMERQLMVMSDEAQGRE